MLNVLKIFVFLYLELSFKKLAILNVFRLRLRTIYLLQIYLKIHKNLNFWLNTLCYNVKSISYADRIKRYN